MVPVARPESTRALVRLAAALARPDSGSVVPVTIASPDADQATVGGMRTAKDEATSMALSHGVEAEGVMRIDATPDIGIRHTVVEHDASLMVVGWKGTTSRREALFGDILDNIVGTVDVPTIIGRVDEEPVERIVVVVPEEVTRPGSEGGLVLAVEAVRRLRLEQDRPTLLISEHDSEAIAAIAETVLAAAYEHHADGPLPALRATVRPHDLIVLPVERSRDRVPELGARVARAFPHNPLLIVMDGALRRVGDLSHDHLSTEHPFGPPPWAKSS